MDLVEQLNAAVSEAILRAEKLERKGTPAQLMAAFLEVSRLEEELARCLPATSVEGAVARRGTVTAALDAGDLMRAREKARRFAAEPGCPVDLVRQLDALARQAEDGLEALQPEGPMVLPVWVQAA